MNDSWIAAAWMGLALLASLLSIRLGISVALVEILVGAVAGNVPALAGWSSRPRSPTSRPPPDQRSSPFWQVRRSTPTASGGTGGQASA